ncbi:MAG TPA: serine hydrolase domain-containing protein, partial [Phnomibacter sp.]|nr:serine hydrolase domain-containing protein [Phnomibacter sp.]
DFALLRWIMEKAANKKLPDYLHEKLFAPLGMSSTFMNDDLEQLIPGLADKYYGESRYLKSFGVKTSPGGNYRIVTTAADLEKWTLALEDPQSIAAKAMLRLYRNARPIPVLSPEVHYTFGHEWQKIGETEVIKHGGVNHDFYMVRIPAREITIIGLGNSNSNMTKAMSLADFYLGFKPGKVEKPPAISAQQKAIGKTDLAKYAGKYFEQKKPGHSSDIPGIQFYDIRCEGDNLNFYYAGNEYFTLMPVGNDLFKDPDFGTIFQFIDPHPDSLMRMQAWPADGSPTIKYVRAPSATNYSTAYLRQFTGRYYSRHLDFYCSIVLNDSNLLVLRRPTIADKPLVTYGTDRFIFEMESGSDSWYVMATFSRNAEGKVDGIDMQHIRMMHHRFDKVD